LGPSGRRTELLSFRSAGIRCVQWAGCGSIGNRLLEAKIERLSYVEETSSNV
jgi:hypothetical protein